ncbi:Long-chain-fatty-acid-CoA ligase 1 [Smittium culicis]|uniref:Long-chain-fatty-acid-CoA ligase 1 n=1 Tax=Smittium culicis TaxID=133412 RepID=A0A1R1XHB4_9FUNG|nr:Long-chain-fatty-acid-CoA ligase 1 [Smittium culicis]OMJ20517.1 Long-chain-fatty-acid-CoA ligase 1 [Smittium culicis]
MYESDPIGSKPDAWTVIHKGTDSTEEVRRYYKDPSKLVDNEWRNGGNNTLYDMLKSVVSKNPNKEIIGKRTIIGIEEVEKKVPMPLPAEDNPNRRKSVVGKIKKRLSTDKNRGYTTKKWTYQKLSPYNWMTYQQLWDKTCLISRGLISREVGLSSTDTMEIFAPTSAEWTTMFISCVRQSIRVATAYDTLGYEGLLFSVNEAGAKVLFTRIDLIGTAAKVASESECLDTIIYFGAGELDKFNPKVSQGLEQAVELIDSKGKKIFSLEQIIEFGSDPSLYKKSSSEAHDSENKTTKPNKESESDSLDESTDEPPTQESIALIMYTSGTTGKPKGVVIKHKNVCSVIGGIQLSLLDTFRSDDIIIAYLPLAHILEFAVEFLAMSLGIRIGYGTPRTLTTSMVHGCLGDLEELKPTLMAGVPQVWNGIAREIMNQVNSKGPIVSRIFNAALKFKWSRMVDNPENQNWVHEGYLFSKAKQIVGGRLRLALSGGAAISPETQQLLSCILCPIVQGYGMTETCGVIAIQKYETFGLGKTGPCIPSIEAKLVSVPDAGYDSKNGQGEVWVRGPSISSGYLVDPPNVEDTFTKDGWLRTGDIAEWTPDGQIKIIDRLKNLVKMSNGEYIALEQLESAYVTSPFVQNICIHAQPDKMQPIAIVAIDEKLSQRLATNVGIDPHTEKSKLVSNDSAKSAVLKSLLDIAKKNNYVKSQTISDVIIDENEWSADNGLLTAAGKLQRKAVENSLKDKIETVYLT